jgi:hypothetical protein
VTSYEADFTIRQADGTVLRGHKTLGDAYQKEMFCNIVSDEPVPGRSGLPVNGELHFGELRGIDYAVTVTAPDGASASTGGDAVFVFNYERYDDFQGSPYLGAQLFTLMYRGEFPAPPDDDTDDDGVEDALGTGAGAWQDASIEPPTIGRIVDRNGLDVRVEDAPDAADGVRITVGGDPGLRATFSVCGFTVRLAGGTDAVFTCGSVSLKVATGRAEIVLAEGAIVTVPGGVAAKVTDADADGGHTVVNQGGGTVTISLGDATAQLAAGQSRAIRTWRFDGFRAPVDNGRVLNSLKAGQAVPLRWRLTRADGTPVTTLTSVKLTVEGLACGAGATADAVEELATGGSGLRNLGNGEYQYNWATPKSYANSCKRLRLDVGDGVTHDALFQFRP